MPRVYAKSGGAEGGISVDCSECIHKRICEIWRSKEAQDASCYVDDCGQTVEDFFKKLLQSMDELKRAYEVAVQDLETIMLQGGKNMDTCAYCRNDQCYVRGGRDCCTPIWRGRDNPSVTAKP